MALLAPAPADPLRAAERCYRDLNYVCAEEHLAAALALGLEGAALRRARLYEAKLAVAHRDFPRARRAVRALLEFDPRYDPGDVPPQLLKLFDEERPPPVPPPVPFGRVDFAAPLLFGADAARWSDGLGVEAGGGVRLWGWLELEAAVTYSDHVPRVAPFEGMDLWSGRVSASVAAPLGPLWASAGLGLGPGVALTRSSLGDEQIWGAWVEAPVQLRWAAYGGLGVGLRASPAAFLVPVGDQAASSYLLPLVVGVRYEH